MKLQGVRDKVSESLSTNRKNFLLAFSWSMFGSLFTLSSLDKDIKWMLFGGGVLEFAGAFWWVVILVLSVFIVGIGFRFIK